MDAKSTKDRRLVDEDINYHSLLAMLESVDKENTVVALQIIENLDFKQFALKIMLLFKEGNVPTEVWKEHAPNTLNKIYKALNKNIDKSKKLYSVSDSFMYISYDDVVRACSSYKISNEDTQLLVSLICKKIQDSFVGYGLSCIESMDIKINFKPDGE